MTPAPNTRLGISLTLAVWAGATFGLVEGTVLVALRAFPALQAAHKLPVAALWVAPLVQIVLLSAGAFLLWLLGERTSLSRFLTPRHLLAAFALCGGCAALSGPGVLHPASVAVLGLGLALVVFRALAGRDERLIAWLQRWLGLVPAGLLLVALALAAGGRLQERRVAASTPAPAGSAMPNILLIVLDTVRRDRFFQNSTTTLAPALERLAGQGIRFINAWATSSWSLPSHATLLTGRLPQVHGADWPRLQLWDSIPTLAESFRARGYVTGAFSSNNSWVTPEYLGRGFLRFRVYRFEDVWSRTAGGRILARVLHTFGRRRDRPGTPAAATNAELLQFLDNYTGRPFFCYITYMDVNRAFYDQQLSYPRWGKRPPLRTGVAAYDAELTRVDAELERLLAALTSRDLLANTIVVVASDHGESFGATDYYDHDPKGHGTSLYPEQIRVPFFVVAPGRVTPGRELGQPVTLADVAGLVVGLSGNDDPRFGRQDLLEALRGSEVLPDTGVSLFATLDYDRHSARTVVEDRWQYIRNRRSDSVPEELFDLAVDSLARQNLAPASPLLPDFRALLHRYRPDEAPAPGDRR